MWDESLAGADSDLNADSLDSGDDSVDHLASERPVDEGLEGDGEDRVTAVVDDSFLDALDPRVKKTYLKMLIRYPYLMLQVPTKLFSLQSAPNLPLVDEVLQSGAQVVWRDHDVLFYLD